MGFVFCSGISIPRITAAARLATPYSVETARAQMGNGDSVSRVNGFLALSALLVDNAQMPEVYAMLTQLLLGIRTPLIPSSMASLFAAFI